MSMTWEMISERMPSDTFFQYVKTEEDYDKLYASGMAWEFEPNFPKNWNTCEYMIGFYHHAKEFLNERS